MTGCLHSLCQKIFISITGSKLGVHKVLVVFNREGVDHYKTKDRNLEQYNLCLFIRMLPQCCGGKRAKRLLSKYKS